MKERVNTLEIKTNVYSTQAKNCLFCIHIGTVAIFFGKGKREIGKRLELFTPSRKFRWR